MKTIKYISLFFITLLFNACMDEYTEEFMANSPLYITFDELRSSVQKTDSRELNNVGKIYFKDGYLFINEEMEGVHIIDNRNPASPQNIGFLEIPGNVDIAIKNNTLYADSYVDIVAIDISDLSNPKEVNRLEDIFPYSIPPLEDQELRIAEVDEEKGVVIGWEIKKVTQKLDQRTYPIYYPYLEFDTRVDANFGAKAPSAAPGSTFGIGGSMARFGLYNDYLYAVDHSVLYMFDVENPEDPEHIGNQGVGWQIETMFIYDDHMFFGTQNGMRIFSLEVPTAPNYIGEFWHVTSCDPVVVSDGYAYVTLRGGTQCGSNVNRLDVIELSENYIENKLVASYPLHGPYGLGIDDQTLFICDGDAGLKVYDVADKLRIDDNQLAVFNSINAFDVIPFNNYLFMIGEDGFYQYDYSDLQNIQQLSFIPVVKDED